MFDAISTLARRLEADHAILREALVRQDSYVFAVGLAAEMLHAAAIETVHQQLCLCRKLLWTSCQTRCSMLRNRLDLNALICCGASIRRASQLAGTNARGRDKQPGQSGE